MFRKILLSKSWKKQKQIGLKEYVCHFSVHYNTIDVSNIIDIYQYLMKIDNIKRCLYVVMMSRMHFKVNPHSVFTWMSRTPCSKQVQYLKFKWLQRDSNQQPLSS